MWANSRAICSGGRTKSATPPATAFKGMAEYSADSSSWAKVMPLLALIWANPKAPSEPVPERITPTARSLHSRARERKKIIHRQVRGLLGSAGGQTQHVSGDSHVGVGGDDVDMVGADGHAVGDFRDRQARGFGQQIGQFALVSGIQVLDEH